MQRSRLKSSPLKALGWIFFTLYFLLFLVSLKGGSVAISVILLAFFFLSAVITVIYYFFWHKVFPNILRENGLEYIRPYRLCFLIVSISLIGVYSLAFMFGTG